MNVATRISRWLLQTLGHCGSCSCGVGYTTAAPAINLAISIIIWERSGLQQQLLAREVAIKQSTLAKKVAMKTNWLERRWRSRHNLQVKPTLDRLRNCTTRRGETGGAGDVEGNEKTIWCSYCTGAFNRAQLLATLWCFILLFSYRLGAGYFFGCFFAPNP